MRILIQALNAIIPSALYSYSFAPNPTWDFKWAKQPQILKYLEDFAKERDLLRHVKFGRMVAGADYRNGRWAVKTNSGEIYDCQFFVSAIGQLHVPSTPDFKGKDTFKGASFHSAQWDHSVDLKEKNIGVIGVGARRRAINSRGRETCKPTDDLSTLPQLGYQ